MISALRILASRWFVSFIGTVLLAGLVWVFGPFLGLLDSPLVRLVVISAMVLVWFGINLALDLRRRARDRALTEGVAAEPIDPAAAASAEEAAALREKLTAALTLLKKARGTRGYLYEQPWYAIIGPPGAGKTTALLNGGLTFPLAEEMGAGAVGGVGGTRLCDWWFTEDAVLIDTAGRYTTQDSDAVVDRAGWDSFLDLLKRTRTRQPLNGVIVAIPLSDIATAPADERLAHARAIRRRIKELETRLAIRIPVYAMFTKADLIAGFSEFFDDLDREKRKQVWGVTFPPDPVDGSSPRAFGPEFRALVERLANRLFDRVQAERSPEKRALIAGFPTQLATMEQPLTSFLQECFGGSRLDPAPFLRGMYLTSGTQEGTPVDRLTGALARAFGVEPRRAPSLRPEKGRSYFLTRLLKDVIFGEAMLVSERPGARRRRWLIRAASFAAVLIATVAGGAVLLQARSTGGQNIDAASAALARYEQSAQDVKLDPVADADLPRLVPLLDQARALPHGVDDAGNPDGFGLGLSQDAKLAAAARALYRHALERALLPRLIWRLEAQMRGNFNRPDFLYEATRVYLMLGGGGPLDRELVEEWMSLDWQAGYPGVTADPLRTSLARHLDALLAEPLPPVLLDGDLVARARTAFSRVTLAQRVYSRIKPSAAAQRLAPWRPADPLGAAGAQVFTRASGKPLTEGIPGFLTVDGFHKVLLTSLASAATEVASESWVLGQRAELNPASPEMQNLERDVIALYEADYMDAWDAMLADLNVVQMNSLTQAAQDLYILSSPQSPMRDLLASMARQLTLSVTSSPAQGAAGAVQGAVAAVQSAAAGEQSRLQTLLGAPAAGAPAKPPGWEIDEHYKTLRDLVGNGPGAPIEQVLKTLNDLQQQLAKLAAAPAGVSPPASVATGVDPALALRAEAQRQPQPLSRWLAAMAASGTAFRSGNARQQIAAAFNGEGGPAALCNLATSGRYPFVRGSSQDVPLDDFARLFAPGGMLDGFFNTQLRPYVDMSGKTWKPQAVDGVPAPVSAEDVAQFQQAATIRDLFFAGGGTTPSVRFDIAPVSLDPGAQQVTLDLDGTEVVYAQGPTRSTQITWPGPSRMQNVRLIFIPASPTGVVAETGPWALFRLFDHGKLQQAGAVDRFTLTFQVGPRQAVFEIHAGSVFNPLSPTLLQDFHCPSVQ